MARTKDLAARRRQQQARKWREAWHVRAFRAERATNPTYDRQIRAALARAAYQRTGRAAAARYYQQHRATALAAAKAYRARVRGTAAYQARRRAERRRWEQRYPEKARAIRRRARQRHPEQKRIQKRRARAKHPERARAKARRTYQRHRERYLAEAKRRHIDALSDSYLRTLLQAKKGEISAELLAAKRLQVQLFRLLRHRA